MSEKKKAAPTYEEFCGVVKTKLQERWPGEDEKDIDSFLKSEEAMIKRDYEKEKADFDAGELSADLFWDGGRYGLIMALELMY